MKNLTLISSLMNAGSNQSIKDQIFELVVSVAEYCKEDTSLPVAGDFVKGCKLISGIQEKILIKKLQVCIECIDSVPKKRKINFLKSLDDDDKRERFGTLLLHVIDKSESPRKAQLIGILFKHMLEGKISDDAFEYLALTVSQTYIHNLYTMYYAQENDNLFGDGLGSCLAALRLVETEIKADIDFDERGMLTARGERGVNRVVLEYKINQHGIWLCDAIEELIKQ